MRGRKEDGMTAKYSQGACVEKLGRTGLEEAGKAAAKKSPQN